MKKLHDMIALLEQTISLKELLLKDLNEFLNRHDSASVDEATLMAKYASAGFLKINIDELKTIVNDLKTVAAEING